MLMRSMKTESEGSNPLRRLRSINQKRYQEGNYDDIIYSHKSPQEIKERQAAYEEGFIGIGDKTGSSDYLDTIA